MDFSKLRTAVAEPLIPILCSMPVQKTFFLLVSRDPSSLMMYFGTRNKEIPCGKKECKKSNREFDNLCSWRCIRQLGQHQMNDVAGEIALSTRDENLGPRNLVGSISHRDCFGLDVRQVTSRARLSEAHCACPLAGGEFGKERVLHLI